MTKGPPLLILPLEISKRISQRLQGPGATIAKIFPGLKYDLEKTDIDITQEEYMAISLLNAFFVFLIFGLIFFILQFIIGKKTLEESIIMALAMSLAICLLYVVLLARYPRILAKKKAEQIEKNLLFALKDMLLEVSAGVSLYHTLVNISKANYGLVSKEFEKVAKQVNTGRPMAKALEALATSSESEYLKKTIWQLINTLHAGASLKGALKTIIRHLSIEQKTKIRDYAKELNMWSLIYMLFAVAVPTMGTTMMVILSSFAGFGITKGMFIAFIMLTFVIQYILIGLIKTRRPMVHI